MLWPALQYDIMLLFMAKRGKKNKKAFSIFSGLREETIHGIWAVIFFVLALILVLSAFGVAGIVGNSLYTFLRNVFGVGYFLLPLVFFILAVTYTGSLRERVATSRIFGALLFFVSSLAFIDLIFEDGGGLVGKYIREPLVTFFGSATGIILVALIIISLLITFDLRFSFAPIMKIGAIFKRKQRPEEDECAVHEPYDEEMPEEATDDEDRVTDGSYEESEEEEKRTAPETEKTGFMGGLFGKKEKSVEEGFRVLPSEKEYIPPPLSLLEKDKGKPNVGDVKANANVIKRTFHNFGIQVEMDEVSIGPTVTRYALKPAEGVRLSRIIGLQNNLELALAAHPVRIEAPIPGRALVGIEVPNTAKAMIGMAGLLGDKIFKDSTISLLLALGKDIAGGSHFANLGKMPHCLIAGATGSGKSVTIHALITSLLFRNSPEQLRFLMVDPKRVELTLYNDIPHLLAPVITDAKKTILALKWAAKEMDRRYDILESEKVRDIESYHKNILAPALENGRKGGDETELPETMPYIVIIIDELADIMQAYPRELEAAIVRLAQMSRAVGIHLILSTQRPSVNVITGLIKANVPSRIALQVASQIDSRTILDMAGAEKLLGAGDMLYLSGDMSKPQRIQAPFISEGEVKKVVKYLKKSYEDESPDSVDFAAESGGSDVIFSGSLGDDDDAEDNLYEAARETVIKAGKASTSYLQRRLGVGYSRAAKLIDMLEERGVVGPANGSKPRDILEGGENGNEYDGEEGSYEDEYNENENA